LWKDREVEKTHPNPSLGREGLIVSDDLKFNSLTPGLVFSYKLNLSLSLCKRET